MAARAAAVRMAELLGESPGETVGYRVRMESRVGPATRIEVITEGILTRMLQHDPALTGVGLLIFDEFHERSLDSDLGLALALQAREFFRDEPLKLLLMSASLDGAAIANRLQAPIVRSEGRQFPVELCYASPPRGVRGSSGHHGPGKRHPQVLQVVDTLCEILLAPAVGLAGQNSVLVFLPGQAEIKWVAHELRRRLPGQVDGSLVLAPLYGGLSLEQQQQAMRPPEPGRRKVVLSTNIAETSLTIEGVGTVVDSGLVREAVFDPGTGMTRLQTRSVSRASSIQRAGRAGRLGPGRCYRLWSEARQGQLAPHTTPAILQEDLLALVLQLLAWGVDDPAELTWLNPPPRALWEQGLDLLTALGALRPEAGGSRRLTAHGEAMAKLPLHPRLAHMLLCGRALGLGELACELAALLSERAPEEGAGVDMALRLALLRGDEPRPGRQRAWRQRTRQQARQYARLLRAVTGRGSPGADTRASTATSSTTPSTTISTTARGDRDERDKLGVLLAHAYPDRIAKRRQASGGVYQLANGRSARLSDHDPLVNSPWLAVAELGGRVGEAEERIYSAAELAIDRFDDDLTAWVEEHEVVVWDDRAGRLVAERRRQTGRLLLSREPLAAVNPELVREALLALLARRGLQLLPWTPLLRQWQARVNLLREREVLLPGQEQPWPDVSDGALIASLESWLGPYLDGVEKLEHFRRLDLTSALQALLPWSLQRQLERLAPTYWRVPSGSRIPIDYLESPPVLAVKLQEMFGCVTGPVVADGRVVLVLHLLSPARRPLQVTQDLAGFWQGSYREIKKEMKGRYPKHPWPDDPLQALPTRATRRRK